jgi:hypothetical protein
MVTVARSRLTAMAIHFAAVIIPSVKDVGTKLVKVFTVVAAAL